MRRYLKKYLRECLVSLYGLDLSTVNESQEPDVGPSFVKPIWNSIHHVASLLQKLWMRMSAI